MESSTPIQFVSNHVCNYILNDHMKIACYASSTTMKRPIQSYKLHAITGRPGFTIPVNLGLLKRKMESFDWQERRWSSPFGFREQPFPVKFVCTRL